MQIFHKALEAEYADDTKLGMPSKDEGHRVRRLAAMERMTGGRGFTKPAKEPRKDAQALTRGDRKRTARAATNAKVDETREPQFMHRAARIRAGHQQAARPMTGFLATMQEAA